MKLRRLHLPGLVDYAHAGAIQDKLVARFLAHKANPSQRPSPEPTVITAQFRPVYTCGRREIGTVSLDQKMYLTQETSWGKAEFHQALRGGQTTFHGPGQLMAYAVLDLRRHNLNPRDYVCLLEKSVIQTCAHYGIKAQRTDNPGVWVSEQSKICALGVHLRRHISSHGIGLNVSTDLGWFDRIVACGLEGKGTTSLAHEGVSNVTVDDVAAMFVQKLAEGLNGVDEIDQIHEDQVDR